MQFVKIDFFGLSAVNQKNVIKTVSPAAPKRSTCKRVYIHKYVVDYVGVARAISHRENLANLRSPRKSRRDAVFD